jgi:hypothetical protein
MIEAGSWEYTVLLVAAAGIFLLDLWCSREERRNRERRKNYDE